MEVDNVTDIRPADDFDFTMNVRSRAQLEKWEGSKKRSIR